MPQRVGRFVHSCGDVRTCNWSLLLCVLWMLIPSPRVWADGSQDSIRCSIRLLLEVLHFLTLSTNKLFPTLIRLPYHAWYLFAYLKKARWLLIFKFIHNSRESWLLHEQSINFPTNFGFQELIAFSSVLKNLRAPCGYLKYHYAPTGLALNQSQAELFLYIFEGDAPCAHWEFYAYRYVSKLSHKFFIFNSKLNAIVLRAKK